MKTAGSGYCPQCGRRVNAYIGRRGRTVDLFAFRHEREPQQKCAGSNQPVHSPAWYRPQGAAV